MNIYTYFVPVPGIDYDGEMKILQSWRESWQKGGWNPIVLNRPTVMRSSRFPWYDLQIHKNPFMNSDAYEAACFHRWLAMTEIGGGVHSDYDCMNNGLSPDDLEKYIKDGVMTLYEPAHVPSLVSGSYNEYHRMVDLFANFKLADYKPEMHKETRGGTAVSDMLILANNPTVVRPVKIVWEFHREPGWQQAKAIHFSHWACEGIGKITAIHNWIKNR